MSVASFESTRQSRPQYDDGPELLIERLLFEQSELTAVDRFSQRHEVAELPVREKFYRDLIPLSQPGPGEQYAFRVDLDSCSGCKACVAACHEQNGLEDEETWRDVGLLVGTSADLPILQHVTAACHHCLDPGCLAGCPVRAYDKDPRTGIVRHLDDQCIGCQYCIWTCPYEVPKFSTSKGIVRKCDMCQQRLAANEAPACVQSCPNLAISIDLVRLDEMRGRAAGGEFLAAAPNPRITTPTTRYMTRRTDVFMAKSADFHYDQPQHAHWPLVIMLVMTQLSVGMLLAERLLTSAFNTVAPAFDAGIWSHSQFPLALATLIAVAIGLGIANFHLGRPWLAFRALLGWRTSWLSREILAFGAFAAIDAAYVIMLWQQAALGIPRWGIELCGYAAAAIGLIAVTISAMVYVATRREAWPAKRVFWQFGLSIVFFGMTTGLVALTLSRLNSIGLRLSPLGMLVWCILLESGAILTSARLFRTGWFLRRHAHLDRSGKELTTDMRIVGLLNGPLRRQTRLRAALGYVSGVIFPLLVAAQPSLTDLRITATHASVLLTLIAAAVVMRLASETLERYLFFVTAIHRKMPGGMP